MKRILKSILSAAALVIPPAIIYGKTMPPSLTWEHFASDGGELIAAIYTWGIPHPPGTPLFVFVGQLFRYLPFIADPALKMNIMSAFFALATLGVTYKILRLLIGNKTLSVVATYFLAFGVTFWAQAIVAEVLTLNVFLVSLTTYFLLRWHVTVSHPQKYLHQAAFAYGLALTNHTSSLCLIPAIAYLVGVTDHQEIINPKKAVRILAYTLLGLSPYLYIYLRAQATPQLNWGDPGTIARFFDHLTAKEYQDFLFFKNWHLIIDNLFRALQIFWSNFNPAGSALLLIALFFSKASGIKDFLVFSVCFQVAINSNYNIFNIVTFYLPSLFFLTLLLGLGLKESLPLLEAVADKIRQKKDILFLNLKSFTVGPLTTKELNIRLDQAFSVVVGTLVIGLSFFNVIFHYQEVDISQDREADNFGRQTFSVLDPGAIVITGTDRYTLGLMYYRYVVFPEREDVALVSNGTFLKNFWQISNLQNQYPNLKYPEVTPETMAQEEKLAKERLLEFIALNLPEHPVYLAEVYPPFNPNFALRSVFEDKYVVESKGPIYKIIGEVEE